MDKLSINDLEEGKIYKFTLADGVKCAHTHRIKNNILQVKAIGKAIWEDSILSYNNAISGYFTEIKREINWAKVPRGTKVQVRDKEEYEFENMYFIKFCKNERVPFEVNSCFSVSPCLDDDYTGFKMENYNNFWKYCRIHPSVQIADDWYKEEK